MNNSFLVKNQIVQRKERAVDGVYYDCFVAIGFLIAFLICKLLSFTILFYACAVLLTLYMLFCKPSSLILMMVFILPSSGLIKLTSASSAILGYCFLIGEIKYLVINTSKIKISLILVLLTLCVGLTVFYYLDYSLGLTIFRFMVSMVFLYFVSGDDKLISRLQKNGINVFIAGTIFNIVLGLAYYFFTKRNVFSGNFCGVSLDRNFYSAVISMAISFAVIQFFISKRALLTFAELVFLFFGGLLSGSRTFLVSLIIPILIVLYFLFSGKYIKKVLPFIFVLLAVGLLFSSLLSPLLNMTIDRFDASDVSTANGRYDIWKYYLEKTTSNPTSFFIGSSFKTDLYISTNHTLHDVVHHNTFIQSLSTIGVLGTSLLILSFYKLFVLLKRPGKKRFVFLFPLFSLILCYFFINGLFSDLLTIMIFLSFMFYQCQTNEYENSAN